MSTSGTISAREKFGDHVAHEMEQEVNKAFGRWYRHAPGFARGKEAYRSLLSRLIDSGEADKVVTAYFMMRHTAVSDYPDHSIGINQEFAPLLRRFEELRRTHGDPELRSRLHAAMTRYPVRIEASRH